MSTEPVTPTPPPPARPAPSHRSRRIWLVAGVVLVIAVIAFLVTRGGDDNDDSASSSADGVPVGKPTILSQSQLSEFARKQSIPVYWAGPLPNRRLEVTKTKSGRYFVRYLTPKAAVGDRSPRFLTVGTYPGSNAYGALQVVGNRKNTKVIRTQSGALVVYSLKKPTSVYFAFPGQNFQVEVYDPRAERARRYVLNGKLQRVK